MKITNTDLLIGGIVGGVILNAAAESRSEELQSQISDLNNNISNTNRNLLDEQRLTNRLLLMTAEERAAYVIKQKQIREYEIRAQYRREQHCKAIELANAERIVAEMGMSDSSWKKNGQSVGHVIVNIILFITFFVGLLAWFGGPTAGIIVTFIWLGCFFGCVCSREEDEKKQKYLDEQRNIVKRNSESIKRLQTKTNHDSTLSVRAQAIIEKWGPNTDRAGVIEKLTRAGCSANYAKTLYQKFAKRNAGII